MKEKITKTIYVELERKQTYYAKIEITKDCDMILGEDYTNKDELFDEVYNDEFCSEAEKIAIKNLENGNSEGYEKDINEEIEIYDSYIEN